MLWLFGLRRFIRHGRLLVSDADGNAHEFGNAGATPSCAIRLHARSLHLKLPLTRDIKAVLLTRDNMFDAARGSTHRVEVSHAVA